MPRSDKMTSISPQRLKYAREYYGLSIYDVVSRIKQIKFEELESYEAGTDFPSYTKLEALSNLYNRPLLYFFYKTTPQDEPLSIAFRSVENQVGTSLSMQVRIMMEKADWYRVNLIDLFNNVPPVRFKTLLENDRITSTQELFPWLRNKLDLSLDKQKKEFSRADTLLEYLRKQLYNIGIYMFKDSFRADDVSGLCLYDQDFPVILLNNKTSFTRQVFTVFHEIYHLFSKEADVCFPKLSEEKACDIFASEFLIPNEDLAIQLSDRTFFEDSDFISQLAKLYTVSPAAIAYRLMQQQKISKNFFLTIQEDGIRKMNSASSGGNFYLTRISYLGRPYLKQVFEKYYTGKINVATVGIYTGLKASHISKLSSSMVGGVL